MDAPDDQTTPAESEWLTREQIDSVIGTMSASDLIDAMGDGEKIKGPKMAGDAFNAAAARQGLSNGVRATERVRMADFAYLAERISSAVNVESPLSEGQEA